MKKKKQKTSLKNILMISWIILISLLTAIMLFVYMAGYYRYLQGLGN